jgi:hypothetical protein
VVRNYCLSVLALFILMSCSPYKVHLHTQGMGEQDTSKIAQQIERAGFDVLIKSNKHPQASRGNLVLTPAYGQSFYEPLEHLQRVLESQGFISDALPSPLRNHIYSPRNFGVYLVARSHAEDIIVQVAQEEWPLSQFEFLSTHCEQSFALWLNDDGSARLFNELEQIDFTWQEMSQVKLLTPAGVFWFEVRRKIYSRGQRKIIDVYLEPVGNYPLPYSCDFKGQMIFSG